MKVSLTLLVQTVVVAQDDDDYEKKRDQLVRQFESEGFSVDIENEEDIDYEARTESRCQSRPRLR